jgi:raffinose/stachyose/melibiose transport system permease protein
MTASLLLCAYAVVALAPLLLVLANSLRSNDAITSAPLGWPAKDWSANFATAWSQGHFSTYFANSLIVTTGALVLGVGVATLAGYGLGRFRFRGRDTLGGFFLAGLLLPAQLGVVPVFHLLRLLGLIDTRLGLVLVHAAHTLPLSVLLLSQFFRQLPAELEEAARLDGAGEWAIFRRVMLPLVRPALATVLVVQCAPIWNDVFYPLVLLRSPALFTLPIGLTGFVGQYQSDLGGLFAALVIVTLPLITLFLVATRQVIAGLTAGIGK